jgi:hypothetical protein
MPRFTSPRPVRNTKILYLGHTGAGKTGSLCSLASAGYNVRILDLDNGTELIDDFMLNKEKSIYLKERPGLWTAQQASTAPDRLSYVTITEGYKLQGPRAISKGDSWAKIQNQLNNWKDGSESFGNIATWKPEDVLVIDGLSRLCESAMNFQLAMNGRSVTGPQVGTAATNDYSAAYRYILDFLDLLKCEDIKCNVIMICHIAFLDVNPDRGNPGTSSAQREMKGFPQTVGRMISPKIGQYFNHALQAKSIVAGKRVIVTNTSDQVELKNSAPLRVKASYPLETGLAEYFRDIRQLPYHDSTPAKQVETEKEAAE